MYQRFCIIFLLFSSSSAFVTPQINTERLDIGRFLSQTIRGYRKTLDQLPLTCPPTAFYHEGSCYFYWPPPNLSSLASLALERLAKIGSDGISIDDASQKCRQLKRLLGGTNMFWSDNSELWDIDNAEEFDHVIRQIFPRVELNQIGRIAVNFTQAKTILGLNPTHQRGIFRVINISNDSINCVHPTDNMDDLQGLVIEISRIIGKEKVLLKPHYPGDNYSGKFICKMKINSCHKTNRCGPHGHCQNFGGKHKCICNIMYTGDACDKFLGNSKTLQTFAGGCLVLLTLFVCFFQSICNSSIQLRRAHRRDLVKRKIRSMATRARDRPFYSIPNQSSDELILSADEGLRNMAFSNDNDPSNLHLTMSLSDTIIDCSVKSSSISSSPPTRCYSSKRLLFVFVRFSMAFLTLLFATLCCWHIYEFKWEHSKDCAKLNNDTDSTKPRLCDLFKTHLESFYKIPANWISLGILALLIISMVIFENFSARKKRSFKKLWQHFSMPVIFNSHSHIYRFQSAAVFGIIALEILHIFEKYIVRSDEHFKNGPLVDLVIQFGLGLLLGMRYFPLLAIFEKENIYEDRLEHSITYGLASIYLYGEIFFKLQSDLDCRGDQEKFRLIKETIRKLTRKGLNATEYLADRSGLLHASILNRTLANITGDDRDEVGNDFEQLKYACDLGKESIWYNILRLAPYYYFISYLAVCLTYFFIRTILGRIPKSSRSYQNSARWKYVKSNLLQVMRSSDQYLLVEYSRLFHCLNGIIQLFTRYVYSIRSYFRYSKLIICIYTSAFTLIYYFTFWIQDHIYALAKKLLVYLNLIICGLDNQSDLCYTIELKDINRDIKYICLFTAVVTCLQLFFGLRHYQRQMCDSYRGVFNDIPSSKHMSSVSIISRSIHYPGRFMGSLVYSYYFLFSFVAIFYLIVRYIFSSWIVLEFSSKLILPMIIFFLFQLLTVRLLCKLLFIQKTHLLALRNLRLYYAFSYFCFFFDCFLGVITCITRISKAFFFALIFFARLDYSPYGRGLELYDSSYASYVSFFHVERNQRHPVLNVFIDIVRQRLIDRRKLYLKSTPDNLSYTEERQRATQLARFRWFLAYTLIHNEQLKRFRKYRLTSNRSFQSHTLQRLFGHIGLGQTLPKKF